MNTALTPLARCLLWDYERGSLPYDAACVVILVLLLCVPPGWWHDPFWMVR